MPKKIWPKGYDTDASMKTSYDRQERLTKLDIKYHINTEDLPVIRPPSEMIMEVHEAIRNVLIKYKRTES